ncbi:conserved exported hypothetical protein [uncultured Desulfobacterium sp.]|uniref:TRL-like family protein n=1 Tax=uncultured Desulfobacterium sp. TaxID=201089 RepID=A0A445MX35_9BACT|nr:conserved exported hypothetical protein [uncultured Desulfobacterium sp.]
MKKVISIILLIVLFAFSGCAYVNVKTPYDTDLDQTTLGDKVGKASCYSILWLVAWGDAGTAAAAKDGNITVINHMDAQVVSILFGLYCSNTTIVYGN